MKAYKYRLYPTLRQIETLEWTLDRCRELYNTALQERRDAYNINVRQHPNYYDEDIRRQRISEYAIGYNEQSAQLPAIKEIREEYKEIYAQVLQDVLRRVDKGMKAFFHRVKAGQVPGYPRFQGKGRFNSFTYPQIERLKGNPTISIENGKVVLPKIGHIKIKQHRPLQGKMKMATIKREGEHWYIIFACEVESVRQTPYTDLAIGIDMGLLHFATTSDGDTIENPRHFRKSHGHLKKMQHNLSRKKKGSNRRRQAARLVARTHRKIAKQRRDLHHKSARILVNTYEIIVFEDLSVHHMVRRSKPKKDEYGRYLPNGAAAKGGLNKSIHDAGWADFIELVSHKAAWAGVNVYKVNPNKTSQICSACHKEGEHKDLSMRTHICAYCGLVLDRDVNAAKNIRLSGKERGIALP